MPVPKRKTSKRRRDQRSASKFIRPQSIHGCSNCGTPMIPHAACTECGFYKGVQAIPGRRERMAARQAARAEAAALAEARQAASSDSSAQAQ